MSFRGVRGAIGVKANTSDEIIAATRELLEQMADINDLQPTDIASVIFTATPDLNAAYPACAAREMGWVHVPLLCMQEMHVVGSIQQCIRVLLHWNTDKPPDQIRHVYLGAARALRPDLLEDRVHEVKSGAEQSATEDRVQSATEECLA